MPALPPAVWSTTRRSAGSKEGDQNRNTHVTAPLRQRRNSNSRPRSRTPWRGREHRRSRTAL